MHKKPELLLPAGNTESFFAALQAGADAVYLGLSQFNARARASNFSQYQFISVLKEAKKRKVLVYVTLNTVIKNAEIGSLIEYLHFLIETGADGIIVQDWGVYYIAKKYFPQLKIHASTQMGVHNSLGTKHLADKGFQRTVLARELTLKELETVVKKSSIETEVFVHGALCYSFSGMCLFSSYTGGRGANRGICAQPCRREYDVKNHKKYLFNLKDNQLLEYVPKLTEMGVSSLKIEGRLKSGEYTNRVGSAYRMVLDDETKIQEALQSLELDFGRQKTSYFLGSGVKSAISEQTSTGIYLGKVEKVSGNKILISSVLPLEPRFRLRFLGKDGAEPVYVVVKNPVKEGDFYRVEKENQKIEVQSRVFLTKLQDQKFQDKLENVTQLPFKPISLEFKKSILNGLVVKQECGIEKLYFRIASLEWLSLINFNELDGLFLSFSKIIWSRFNPEDVFIQNNRDKVYIELPKFIAEDSIGFYTGLVNKMVKHGIRNFVNSHLSQKLLIPENCRIITNENVYAFNDAAVKCIQNEGVESFIYPFEIDFETLESINCKSGIVPVYFYPELFYSRMPVQLESSEEFAGDDTKTKYKRYRKNGITIIVPDRAVSILHHKNRLSKIGFSSFLIDVSYDIFSKNRLKTLKTRFLKSEQIQPTTTFNFTKGFK
ncbi:MAG TPA: peptidase U32 family protein [Draconibacterium sp.]|nr:peptidase U32 family protein [Draconibacterium sp.]